jgi:hypothetical protein
VVDPPDTASAPLPFVARAGELAELHAWWRGVVAGESGELMVIAGEPGVGKTRLAQEFGRRLQAEGATVLFGAASDHRFLPYEPWVKAIRTLTGAPWVQVLRDGTGATAAGPPDESAVAAAMTKVLRRLTADGSSVALVIDDIHWADTESVRLLQWVVATAMPRVGIAVVERRPTVVRRAWATVDRSTARTREVVVGRFDRATSAQLVGALTATAPSAEFVDAIHDASGGNAFVLESLVELARPWRASAGGLVVDLPQTAASIWGDRFSSLPAEALDVLVVASVVGTTFERWILSGASSSDETTVGALEYAHAAALIEPADETRELWRFSHALLREHLYERLTETRRRRLHRAVARTMEESYGLEVSDRSAQIAYHWRESGPSGRWPTLRHTINAARWAFLQGSRDTTRLLGAQAVELITSLEDDAGDVAPLMAARVDLGDVLLRVRDDSAGLLMTTAAAYYEKIGDVDALARIADALLRAGKSLGQADPGSALAERLVPRLDRIDPRLHSRVLARLARVLEGRVGADEYLAAISHKALALARSTGDHETLAIALYCCNTSRPWSDDRLDRARELADLGDRDDNIEYSLLGRHMLCTQLLDRGDVSEAGEVLDELCALVDRAPRGYAGAIRNADLAQVAELTELNQRAIRAQLLGRFDEQLQFVERMERFTVDSEVERDRVSSITITQRGLLALDRGRIAELAPLVVAFAEDQPETTQRQVTAGFVLAWIGEHAAARRHYDPIIESELRSITVEQSMAFMLLLLAWTTHLLGDAAGARLAEARLAPFSGRGSCYFGGCLGPMDFGLGLAAWAQGHTDTAEHRFGSAITQADRWGARPIGSRIRLARAQLGLQIGTQPAAVRADADAALDAAELLGMPEVAEHARAVLWQLGSAGTR